MNIIQQIDAEQVAALSAKRKTPEFSPGDTVKVWVKVREGGKERLQAYEGVVIARAGKGLNENFTVRKVSYGEGVERLFPIFSPMVDSIDVLRRGKVRRAKLYYLRGLRGKAARIFEATNARTKRLNDDVRKEVADAKAVLAAEKEAAKVAAEEAKKAAEEAAKQEAAAKAASEAEEKAPEASGE